MHDLELNSGWKPEYEGIMLQMRAVNTVLQVKLMQMFVS